MSVGGDPRPAGRPRARGSLQGLRCSRKLAAKRPFRLRIPRGRGRHASSDVGALTRMLSGFNTNIRHRGVLFHVQTEDSGRRHPHVITHLYHGGTILASEKSSYRELLAEEDLAGKVKALMEGQHAAMLKRLRAGGLDDVLLERLGPEVFEPGADAVAAGHTQPAPAAHAPPPTPPPTLRDLDAADRPLDELILDYLVDNARRARRQRPPGAGARRDSAASRKLE